MTGSDHPDWSAIRRLYAAGKQSLASIARQHGISVQRIYRRRQQEGWPPRGQALTRKTKAKRTAARAHTGDAAPPARSPASRSLKARRALVRRLYKAIDTKLQQMERRMAQDMADHPHTSDATAADHERDTRAIGALIANLSRVTEIEADLERAPASSPSEHADRDLADEAECFRREVAERLARLVRPA